LKAFHLNIYVPVFLIVFISFLTAGCANKKSPESWDTDILKQLPEISVTPPSSSHIEPIQAGDIVPNSEGVLDLSIELAVITALQHNPDLVIQRLEPLKSGAFEMMEQASFDPEVFADISYLQEKIPETAGTDDHQTITEKTEEKAVDLRKTFSTGTTIETGLSHERFRSDDETPEEQKTRIGISLTQSLLKGFGPSVNLARVRQANLDTVISIQELKGFTETLIADTENAYWQYVLSKQKITIFEQSLAIAKKQRDEVEQQIAVGILPRTEAAAARSEVALREQDLIDAESLAEEHRLKLLHLIGPGYAGLFELMVNLTSKPDIDTMPVSDLPDRIKLAEKSRSDLNEARLQLEKNRLETIMTRNGLLPKLDFFISLGRTGYSDTFKDTFQHLEKNETHDLAIGLTFTHSIGNRENKGENKAAQVSRLQAQKAVENLQTLIKLNVRLAVNEVDRARKQITATRTTRTFQEETYAAEKDRFDVGSSTALLVAQAQRDLMAARLAEVEAIVNFRIAIVNLYLTEGSLLYMRGIKIDSVGSSDWGHSAMETEQAQLLQN